MVSLRVIERVLTEMWKEQRWAESERLELNRWRTMVVPDRLVVCYRGLGEGMRHRRSNGGRHVDDQRFETGGSDWCSNGDVNDTGCWHCRLGQKRV